MTKRLLSALLALILVVGLLPSGALAANSWDGSTATEPAFKDDAYQIGTAAELAWFRNQVNLEGEAGAAYRTADAVLTADIDLGSHPWTPIGGGTGYATTYYAGKFDGQHFTVSNFRIDATYNFSGFFGYVKDSGSISNLSIEGAEITSTASSVGGVVGAFLGTRIENCSFSGSVTNSKPKDAQAGGIVGYSNNNPIVITGCVNNAKITAYSAGGIIGNSTQKNTSVENCYNTGTVTGSFRSAGIAGQLSSTGTISNCYNIGPIKGAASTIGGIYGFFSGTINNCYYHLPETQSPGGAASGGTKIDSHDGLLGKLNADGNDAWVAPPAGENEGYPMLSWQSVSTAPAEPSLSLRGGAVLHVESGAGDNQTTLTATTTNMEGLDVGEVSWKITGNAGGSADSIATLEPVENTTDSVVVKAASGGVATVTATVTADGEEYSATRDITVIPHITGAEITNVKSPGAVAMGQTVKAKVFVAGGDEYDYDNYPPLTFQWKYKGATVGSEKTYKIPTDLTEPEKLSVEISCAGVVVRDATDTTADIRSEDYGLLYPVAHDEALQLPAENKDGSALTLPASHTVDDVTAGIAWTSSHPGIIAVNGTVTPPTSGKKTVTLTAQFTYGAAFANRTFEVTVWSKSAVEEETDGPKTYLQEAVNALGDWYNMAPVYGTDTNVTDMLAASLSEKGFEDIDITVSRAAEVYGNCGIAPNGEITYFYADPNGTRGLWFGRYHVSFTLTKDGASLAYENIPVTLHWNVASVKETMTGEILNKVTDAALVGGNESLTQVTSDLTLPKTVDGKKWALISWASSDPAVISISDENQGTADTRFDPYIGQVVRGTTDQTVTLTATATFQRTGLEEPPITLHQTFPVTVKALSGAEADAMRAVLLRKLDTGFDAVGLRDSVTGEALPLVNGAYQAANDIQLPTTRDFRVDGKYYPVTISSSDASVIVAPDVANAARVSVYRPPVGAPAKEVTITVTMTDRKQGISASKEFLISVQPLTQKELDDALALMSLAKKGYFDGLNRGKYQDAYAVSGGLNSFQEAVWNSDRSGITWIYSSQSAAGNGIIADELPHWADQEAWRAFRSSNPRILDHETLNLQARPAEDTFVRVNSVLSHEVFGKYWVKFADVPGYEAFEALHQQPVSAYVLVEGKQTQKPYDQETLALMRAQAEAQISAPISVNFTLRGADGALIQTKADGLTAGATVFEVFRKVLSEEGYSYTSKGSYIRSVTDPYGTILSEKDAGARSGWIYRVNGTLPSVYMNGFSLEDGDEVVVLFTKDYTKEEGYQGESSDRPGTSSGQRPAETQQTTKSAKVPVSASVNGEGKASVSVEDKTLLKALDEAVKAAEKAGDNTIAEVNIAVSLSEKADSLEVAVSAAALRAISKGKNVQLTLQSDLGTMTFDQKTLAGLAPNAKDAAQVAITLKQADNSGLSPLIRAAADSNPVFDLSVHVEGKPVHHFGGKATVFLPYEPPASVNPSALAVYYLGEDGTVEEMEQSGYDKNRKGMAFTTDHFSLFTIAQDIAVLPFSDVAKTDWFYQDVRFAYGRQLFKGTSATAFSPNAPMTRGMLVTVLHRMHENQPETYGVAAKSTAQFSDVSPGSWYSDAVVWAGGTGLVNGIGGSQFGPDLSITRQDLAVILHRYANAIGLTLPQTRPVVAFADQAQLAPYAKDAISALYQAGILNGKENQLFDCTGKATRAEVAALLHRFAAAAEQ